MELTWGERQIDNIDNGRSKDRSTYFQKPGGDRIRVRLLVRTVEKNLIDVLNSKTRTHDLLPLQRRFLVVTEKKWLKLIYIYGSYLKIKTGVSLLDHSVGSPLWFIALSLIIRPQFAVECLRRSNQQGWVTLGQKLGRSGWVDRGQSNFNAVWERHGVVACKTSHVDIFCRLSRMHERDRQTGSLALLATCHYSVRR